MLEDREIIRRCQLGQMGLLDLLIDRHKVDLYSLCRKLTRNATDADDLFQDTWVNVIKHLDGYSDDRAFKTWLFRICLNRYRDLYRWRKRWWRRLGRLSSGGHGRQEAERANTREPDPEERMISEERKTAVREAMGKLEDMFRLPVILHYFHDMSTVEIGETLGIPAGTVKSRLSAARERLRYAMEAEGHG